ncbi:30 kDa heat shock protein [[Candida] anglica]|uniref:30 kDa heat shock protein n=1 Tax=[Candida] anglica TaxID=148631 RepID=A0ABP0EI26_9ASCO
MSAISNFYARAGNNVLEINPPSDLVDIHITNHGSDWLWAAFSVFSVFTLVHSFIFAFSSSSNRVLKKALFVGPLITNFVMAIVYFTYASNLGNAGVPVEFHHVTTSKGLGVRQMFYVKFIGYFLCWPFVLYSIEVATHTLDLSSKTSAGETISGFISIISGLFIKVFATEVFVLGLLIGVLIESTYKWGYFTFGAAGLIFAISLVIGSLVHATRSIKTSKFAILVISVELIVWILYPVAWGLCEGGNVIQPDSEAVFYGVLDLITFAVVPTILTFLNASGLDENHLLHFHLRSQYSNEKVANSPRESGDTAVPPSANPIVADNEPTETV